MSELYWLTDEQMARLQRFFRRSHGRLRVDNRRVDDRRVDDQQVLSGIIFVNRNGLQWRDALREYGPAKTLCNWWKRWSDKGVFVAMMDGLASRGAERKTIMIDASYLKAHRTASSLRKKRGGCWPADRAHERRHEHEASRCDGCQGPLYQLLHDGGAGQRLHWSGSLGGWSAQSRLAAGRPRLRCRLVPRCP
jgi:transposase